MDSDEIKVVGFITEMGNGLFGIWDNFSLSKDDRFELMGVMKKYQAVDKIKCYDSLQELFAAKAKEDQDSVVTDDYQEGAVVAKLSDFSGYCDTVSFAAKNIRGAGCYILFSRQVRMHCYTKMLAGAIPFYYAAAEVYNGLEYIEVFTYSAGGEEDIQPIIRRIYLKCEEYL